MTDEQQEPKPKPITSVDNQERCGAPECGHYHYLHGNGSKAHAFDTKCSVKGCDCAKFVKPSGKRQSKPRPPKTLDRNDPKIFEVTKAPPTTP